MENKEELKKELYESLIKKAKGYQYEEIKTYIKDNNGKQEKVIEKTTKDIYQDYICTLPKLEGWHIKDYVYLQGFKEIEDVLTQDFSIKEKLYYGAIALDDLPLLNDDIVAALNNHSIILPKSSKIIN